MSQGWSPGFSAGPWVVRSTDLPPEGLPISCLCSSLCHLPPRAWRPPPRSPAGLNLHLEPPHRCPCQPGPTQDPSPTQPTLALAMPPVTTPSIHTAVPLAVHPGSSPSGSTALHPNVGAPLLCMGTFSQLPPLLSR